MPHHKNLILGEKTNTKQDLISSFLHIGHFFHFNYMVISGLIMLIKRKARPSIPLELSIGDTTRENCSSHSSIIIPCSFFD